MLSSELCVVIAPQLEPGSRWPEKSFPVTVVPSVCCNHKAAMGRWAVILASGDGIAGHDMVVDTVRLGDAQNLAGECPIRVGFYA